MPASTVPNRVKRHAQRGAALLIILTIITMAALALLVIALNSGGALIERDKVTTAALAHAKDALINFAASHATLPGSLPCPDVDNNGTGDRTGQMCNAYIGRLPWKELNLPDLRDSSGECLWYALSSTFRDALPAGSRSPVLFPLNSNTTGQLSIYNTTGTILPAPSNPVIAIVFSTGPALSGQNRALAGAPTVCGGNNNPANYLDNASGINNATGGGTTTRFITADKTSTFNDRLLNITASQFFPLVKKRVVAEIRGLSQPPMSGLRQYYFNPVNHVYPWAATAGSSGLEVPLLASGLVPYALLTFNPVTTNIWLTNNDWFSLATYRVSTNFQPGTSYPQQCGAGGAGCLSVNGYVNSQAQITVGGISAITCTINAVVISCPYP